MPPTVAIIQARMGSKRLPGKSLAMVGTRPLLEFLVVRLRHSQSLDGIIVATGEDPRNRPIIALARSMGIPCTVGSEEDVLARFLKAAREHNADVVVRVTADNPFTDPGVLDSLVRFRHQTGADLAVATDLLDGAEVEVTTREALARANQSAASTAHREHVTLIMKERTDLFKVRTWKAHPPLNRPDLSVTVDTAEDLKKIRKLQREFGDDAEWGEIISWLDRRE